MQHLCDHAFHGMSVMGGGGCLNRCEIGVKIFLNCIKALSQLMYKIFKLYMNNLKVYNVPVVYIPSTFINVDHFFYRCFLGPNTGPAQWPDCNRYVEAVISKLCQLFPGSKRNPQGIKVDRWTLIGRAYEHIRQCILNNAQVMANTSLQLPSINKTTLTQW